MKKLTALIIAAFIFLTTVPVYGETVDTPLTYTPIPEGESEDDDIRDNDPNRGNRMPPACIICEIDFETGAITGSSPLLADISRYQIWDEEAIICLHESNSAVAMTAALRSFGAGSYMVRLIGPGYALAGIITR